MSNSWTGTEAGEGNSPPKPAKPWFKKWWAWALGVFLLFAAFGALLDDDAPETAAPEPTVTATEPAPDDEPETTPEPEEATSEPEPEIDEEAATQQAVEDFQSRILENFPGGAWSDIVIAQADVSGLSITVERVHGDTVDLRVQEHLSEDEKVAIGQWMFNMSGQQDYDTFVVTDTSGRDQNVFCSASSRRCATSIFDI